MHFGHLICTRLHVVTSDIAKVTVKLDTSQHLMSNANIKRNG